MQAPDGDVQNPSPNQLAVCKRCLTTQRSRFLEEVHKWLWLVSVDLHREYCSVRVKNKVKVLVRSALSNSSTDSSSSYSSGERKHDLMDLCTQAVSNSHRVNNIRQLDTNSGVSPRLSPLYQTLALRQHFSTFPRGH